DRPMLIPTVGLFAPFVFRASDRIVASSLTAVRPLNQLLPTPASYADAVIILLPSSRLGSHFLFSRNIAQHQIKIRLANATAACFLRVFCPLHNRSNTARPCSLCCSIPHATCTSTFLSLPLPALLILPLRSLC